MELTARRAIVWPAAAALIVFTFAPAYGLYRFHDDWTFVYKAAAAVGSRSVAAFITHPLDQHWSPLWHSIEVVNFLVAGWESDWFIRTTIAAATFASLIVCAGFLQSLGVSAPAALVGIAVLALHHAAAAARFSFDTYSQSLADLASWSAVACVVAALIGERRIGRSTVAWLVALVVPALLLKEQALSGFAAIGFVIAIASAWRRDLRAPGPAWALLTALAASAGVFAMVRAAMGVRFAEEGSPFSLCVRCVPLNIAELAGVVVMPVRTLAVLDAARSSPVDIGRLTAAALASAAVACAITGGNLMRARRGPREARTLALLLASLVASFFPVALLFHVGELYTHTALFWFAALVACAVDGFGDVSARARRTTIACAIVYLLVIAQAQRTNLAEMRATGERARIWLARIVDALAPAPDGSFVLITARGAYRGPLDYGLYRVTTPQVLVLTGISPYPVRAATHDRVTVFLDIADRLRWRAAMAAAAARHRAFRLELTTAAATLRPWNGPAEADVVSMPLDELVPVRDTR